MNGIQVTIFLIFSCVYIYGEPHQRFRVEKEPTKIKKISLNANKVIYVSPCF